MGCRRGIVSCVRWCELCEDVRWVHEDLVCPVVVADMPAEVLAGPDVIGFILFPEGTEELNRIVGRFASASSASFFAFRVRNRQRCLRWGTVLEILYFGGFVQIRALGIPRSPTMRSYPRQRLLLAFAIFFVCRTLKQFFEVLHKRVCFCVLRRGFCWCRLVLFGRFF